LVSFIGKLSSPATVLKFLSKVEIPFFTPDIQLNLLIFLEILLFFSISLGIFKKWVFKISAILFIIFSFIIFYILYKGYSLDCGCFGDLISSTATYYSILRNLGLFLISIYLNSNILYIFSIDNFINNDSN
jgi:hypothetical protein